MKDILLVCMDVVFILCCAVLHTCMHGSLDRLAVAIVITNTYVQFVWVCMYTCMYVTLILSIKDLSNYDK